MDKGKTNASNMLQKFKEYVISYMTMLMGIEPAYDDTGAMNRMENEVRAATSFDEVQLLIHRIYAFTMRRDDKTVKNLALQDKIYKELQDLCRDYATREQLSAIMQNIVDSMVNALNGSAPGKLVGIVPDTTEPIKPTGIERVRAILAKRNDDNVMPPLQESSESESDDYTEDSDTEDDMPELESAKTPKITIEDPQAQMKHYLQQRADQARHFEQLINTIPKAQPTAQVPTQIPKVQQPAQVQQKQTPRTAEDEYNEIFRRRPQPQENMSRSVPVTGQTQTPGNPGMGRFVETASRLDNAHQAELLRMMNAMRNGKQ